MRAHTAAVELIALIKKTWTWAVHAMRVTANWWTIRATEWLPGDGIISRRRQSLEERTKLKEIFRGNELARELTDKKSWRNKFRVATGVVKNTRHAKRHPTTIATKSPVVMGGEKPTIERVKSLIVERPSEKRWKMKISMRRFQCEARSVRII